MALRKQQRVTTHAEVRGNSVEDGKENSHRKRCLTNSSSATEAGDDRLNHETDSPASLCSLERVVRPWRVDAGKKVPQLSMSISATSPLSLNRTLIT